MSTVFDFSATDIKGKEHNLGEYRGNVLLIVNTASKCGFTPQYKGLEALYAKYRDKGLVILGFPCNQFGKQEPGSDGEISSFCELNYGVSFPMFGKVDVNGDNAHPLFRHLKKSAPGILGTEGIKWNFTKFLVDKDGKVVDRFAPTDTPESIEASVARLLA
jgi:glutathione peroxidase